MRSQNGETGWGTGTLVMIGALAVVILILVAAIVLAALGGIDSAKLTNWLASAPTPNAASLTHTCMTNIGYGAASSSILGRYWEVIHTFMTAPWSPGHMTNADNLAWESWLADVEVLADDTDALRRPRDYLQVDISLKQMAFLARRLDYNSRQSMSNPMSLAYMNLTVQNNNNMLKLYHSTKTMAASVALNDESCP